MGIISDELSQNLVSVSSSSTGDDINDIVDQESLILMHHTDWYLQGVCLCFGTTGLISYWLCNKDYSKTKFKPEWLLLQWFEQLHEQYTW
jgi:hypothetical protein